MKYIEADFHIDCEDSLRQTAKDLLADIAGQCGFDSFEETGLGLTGYAQRDKFDKSLLDQEIAQFPLQGTSITYDIKDVADKDWNQAWERQGFDPIDIDGKIAIIDAKMPLSECALNPDTIVIGIDAKQAFGTGTHETTRMIVSTLAHLELKGLRVLDCGCGTGILGLTALKLGAKSCVSYDIDEWSVENTRHNAELNHVENISVFQGNANVLSHISGMFDIVMANINRNTLLEDMPKLKVVMAADAMLIISGFYEEDIPMLSDKANETGLQVVSKKNDGRWACLMLKSKTN